MPGGTPTSLSVNGDRRFLGSRLFGWFSASRKHGIDDTFGDN
jgi:hypothetical protein